MAFFNDAVLAATSATSSVNCLVPGFKFYLFKPSDNNEAKHWRSDGHKCFNSTSARMDMPKENHVVTFLP